MAQQASSKTPRETPNVRTWSKTVPPYRFDLRDLDVYVLKEQPDILRAMGRAPVPHRGDLPDLPLILGIVGASGGFFAWGGSNPRNPAADFDGFSGSTAALVASCCFALTLPVLVFIAWRWWSADRHWRPFDAVVLGIVGVCGAVTLAALRSRSGIEILPPAPVSWTTWLAVLLAALLGVAMAVASRGRRMEFRTHFRTVGPTDPDEVRRLVDDLPAGRRDRLADERRRAVERLRERGLIDDRRAADVVALPLGGSPALALDVDDRV